MTLRRWLGAGAVAVVVLASGCAAATGGSPGRGDADGSSAGGTSMTLSSDGASSETAPGRATDSPAGTGSAAASSGTVSSATGPDAPAPTSAPVDEVCAETGDWDATAERTGFSLAGPIVGVEGSSADCYDSVTFWIKPADVAPGYVVEYVPEVIMDGSGLAAPLASAAKLQVTLTAPAYDPDTGRGTLQIPDHDNVVDASGLATIEQVAFAGSFEGQTTFGIGLADELPFAVTTGVDGDGNATLTVAVAHG